MTLGGRMRSIGLAAFAAMMLSQPLAASAADLVQPQAEPPAPVSYVNDWKFQLTLYGWALSLNGDVGIRGLPTVDVDVSFSDILDNLDGAVMGSFFASNGRFVLLSDLIWSKLSDTVDVGPFGGSVNFDQRQLIAQAAAGYTLPLGIPNLQLSATAGLRYNRLKAEVDIDPALLPVSTSREGTKNWIDPTIGLFLHYDINDRWFINALADIGGFGVGSDITAQGFASLGYMWTQSISTAVGYRVIYTDYKKDGFVYDTTMQGPFASVAVPLLSEVGGDDAARDRRDDRRDRASLGAVGVSINPASPAAAAAQGTAQFSQRHERSAGEASE